MSDIELKNISKTFGDTKVIDNVSLTIRAREFMVFLGPSGCGKSTLLRMIAGLESIDEGEIWIDGRRVDRLPPGERQVAMVFQHYALYPHMNVRENLSFGLRNVRMPGDEIERRVNEAAKMLEIAHLLDRKPAQISGGQRQRVAIGRAIVKEPKLFLFDEPLSNLDAALRVRTRIELAQLHQRVGAAMIFVTHDQVEAMTLAQRIIVMNGRKIEQIGTPMEIYSRPATQFVARFVGAPAMNIMPARVVGEGDARADAHAAPGTARDTAVAMGLDARIAAHASPVAARGSDERVGAHASPVDRGSGERVAAHASPVDRGSGERVAAHAGPVTARGSDDRVGAHASRITAGGSDERVGMHASGGTARQAPVGTGSDARIAAHAGTKAAHPAGSERAVPIGAAGVVAAARDISPRFVSIALPDNSIIPTRIDASQLPAADVELKFGIRAEAIDVVAPNAGDTRGRVKFVERLGDRTLVYVCLADDTTVVAEDIGMSKVALGDTIGLKFEPSAVHLFDDTRGYHALSDSER